MLIVLISYCWNYETVSFILTAFSMMNIYFLVRKKLLK